MIPKSLAVAILLLVAGCASGGVSLSRQDISDSYNPGEFAYAGAGRDLHVVVVGNPFGGDREAFGAAVTDAMQGQHFGQRTNFATMPGAEARLTYRVVLVFDPPVGMNAARLCREEALAVQTVRADDGIVLSGAFCRGNSALTRITGRVSAVAGPRDPGFRELVGQVTNGLFPPDRGRDRGSRRCLPWMAC